MNRTRSAAGVAASRILGLVSAIAFTVLAAERFGSDRATDIAFNALILPNALSIMLGSLLPPVFVAVFKSVEVRSGSDTAWAFGRSAPRIVGIVALAASGAGALASPLLARTIGAGFEPEEVAQVGRAMQAAFLLVVVTSVAAVLKALLNADGSFLLPSLDTVAMNAAAITTIYVAAPALGPFSIIAGLVAGGGAKILVMLPGYLRRRRPGPVPLIHPAMKEAGVLLAPVVLNSLVFAVNQGIYRALASGIEGATSYLTYAEKVFSAPQDVLVVSMGAVLLPTLARDAAAGNLDDLRRRAGVGLRMAAFFGIPAAIGLFLVAEPVTALLFERGRFDATDTMETARAVRGYSYALIFSGLIILWQAFYALGRTSAILVSGIVMLVAGSVSGALLVGRWGHEGLALGFSIGYAASFAAALSLFVRMAGSPGLRGLLSGAARTALASVGMGAVVWALGRFALPLRIAAGVSVYVVLARLLCGEEWAIARRLWRRDDA